MLHSREMKKYYLIAIIALSACIGLFAIYHLYQNSKTDGFNRGSIEVTQCVEEDWDWQIYECTGYYTSDVGMMGKDNVSVTVTGDEFHAGDIVYDVYPPAYRSKMDTNHFVTGKERSSVLYNGPWLLLLLMSILSSTSATFYTLGARRKVSSVTS